MTNARKFWFLSMLALGLATTGCAADEAEGEESGTAEQAAKRNGGGGNKNDNDNGPPRTITPYISVKGHEVNVRLDVSQRGRCDNYQVRYVVYAPEAAPWTSQAKDSANDGRCRPAHFQWSHANDIPKNAQVCVKVHNDKGLLEGVTACTTPQ